jgi:hypothetical protein
MGHHLAVDGFDESSDDRHFPKKGEDQMILVHHVDQPV